MTDAEGYGPREGQTDIDRLFEDARTLSPAGVERVAGGWDNRGDTETFRRAEAAALRVLEDSQQATRWERVRDEIRGLTEKEPLVAWQREHGAVGHKAEDALLAAALALVAGPELDRDQRRTLTAPLAEALPWLGDGAPPAAG